MKLCIILVAIWSFYIGHWEEINNRRIEEWLQGLSHRDMRRSLWPKDVVEFELFITVFRVVDEKYFYSETNNHHK